MVERFRRCARLAPVALLLGTSLVSSAGAQDTTGAGLLRLSASVDERQPYVQEQVVLTLRLDSTLAIREGSISAPSIPDAIVEPLGDDRHGSYAIDGRPVAYLERRYAISPQRSGALEIPAFAFEGTTTAAAPRSAARGPSPFGSRFAGDPFFDSFFGRAGSLFERVMGARGEAVQARSRPVSLEVRPRPAAAAGERWLPARDLELVELWGDGEAEPPALRVGEPVDRTLVIRARGVTPSQLPVLALPEVAGLKQYAEPVLEESREQAGGTTAVRALPAVLIPTRAGDLELPAVELAWWDTESDAPRSARLPARTVRVLPAAEPDPSYGGVPPGVAPGAAGDAAAPAAAESGAPLPDGPPRGLGWAVGAAGLLAAGAAVAGIVRGRSRPRPGAAQRGPTGRWRARRRFERALRRACAAGDAAAAESALLALGRLRWLVDPPRDALSLARRSADPALEREVGLLLSGRYGGSDAEWSGAALWSAYRGCRRPARRTAEPKPGALPLLYPGA